MNATTPLPADYSDSTEYAAAAAEALLSLQQLMVRQLTGPPPALPSDDLGLGRLSLMPS